MLICSVAAPRACMSISLFSALKRDLSLSLDAESWHPEPAASASHYVQYSWGKKHCIHSCQESRGEQPVVKLVLRKIILCLFSGHRGVKCWRSRTYLRGNFVIPSTPPLVWCLVFFEGAIQHGTSITASLFWHSSACTCLSAHPDLASSQMFDTWWRKITFSL